MKILKKFRFVSGMLAAMLFASCTLVMDDLPADENIKAYAEDLETVGFDEPYTQETEYGDITFQYSDSTLVLKKAAFDYLVKVDGDTTLYFTDNIPKELLIQPGHYVSMGCSRTLPEGLCNKVLSLIHENGMYKMVTTRAQQEDVFDQFETNLNIDYKTMLSSLELNDNAEILETDTAINMSAYDFSALEGKSTRSITRGIPIEYSGSIEGTRGYAGDGDSNSDSTWTDRDEDVNKTSDSFSDETIPCFSFSTGDSGGTFSKKISDWIKGKTKLGSFLNKLEATGLNVGFSISYNSRKNVTVKTVLNSDPKKSVREETVEDHSKFIFDFDITKSGTYGTKNQDSEEVYKQVENVLRTGGDYDDEVSVAVKLGIAIPAAPAVVVFLRIAPHFNLELGAVGRLECSYVCPTTVTYTKTIGKEDVTPKDKKEPTRKYDGGWKFEKASLFGYAKFSGGIEVCIGVGAGESGLKLDMDGKPSYFTGVALGADFTMALTFNMGINSSGSVSDETYINFNISLSPILRLFFYRWNSKFTLATWVISNKNYYMMPTYGNCDFNITPAYKDYYAKCKVKLGYDNRGIMAYLTPKSLSPIVRLYYESTSGKKYVDMDLEKYQQGGDFTEGNYNFTKELTDVQNVLHIIPGYCYNGKITLFLDKIIKPAVDGEPCLRPEGLYLTKILKAWDYDQSDDSDEYNHYSFTYRITFYNAEYMKEKWKYWGIRVLFEEKDSITTHYQTIMKKDIPMNFLQSNGTYNLNFKFKTESNLSHCITVEPVYWDLKGELNCYEAGDDKQSLFIWFNPDATDEIKTVPKGGTKWNVSL